MTSFCIAIKAQISSPTCPLAAGRCYWQHTKTNECKHTTEELTVEQWCQHVGHKGHPTEEQVQRFRLRLRSELKNA